MADAAHEGPRMNSVIHKAVLRDIDRFDAALQRLTTGDRQRADALADAFGQFDTLLTHHHEGEERHLGRVLRQPEQGGDEVTELSHEHEDIATALAGARAAFGALRTDSGSDEAIGTARNTVTALRTAASDHFAHEEREMTELCARADQAALADALRKLGRDASPKEAMYFLQWVSDDASPDDKAFLRGLIPAPAHVASRLFAGRRYSRTTQAAFG